jgi:hypothetical protein
VFSFGLMGFPLIIVDVRCHSGFVVVVVVFFFVLPEMSYADGSIDPDFLCTVSERFPRKACLRVEVLLAPIERILSASDTRGRLAFVCKAPIHR